MRQPGYLCQALAALQEASAGPSRRNGGSRRTPSDPVCGRPGGGKHGSRVICHGAARAVVAVVGRPVPGAVGDDVGAVFTQVVAPRAAHRQGLWLAFPATVNAVPLAYDAAPD